MEPTICNTSFCCSLSTLSARAVSSVCKQMPSRSVDIHGSAGRGHSASLWIGFPQPTEDTRRIQWHPESLKLSPQWKHPPNLGRLEGFSHLCNFAWPGCDGCDHQPKTPWQQRPCRSWSKETDNSSAEKRASRMYLGGVCPMACKNIQGPSLRQSKNEELEWFLVLYKSHEIL